MQFTINTAKMNSILSRVSKGVGNSKVLPITEYLKITLGEKGLEVVATNSVNFITYADPEVEGTAGSVLVKADKLIKLVAKTTKPEIVFTVKPDHLEVKGNGTYKVELLEGEFPSYTFDENAPAVTVDIATLKKVFNVNASAIAHEMLMPCLTGFNVGDNVVTTDGVKMCLNDTSVLPNERALISQNLAELLNALSGEKVTVQKDGIKLLFTTPNVIVFGPELDGIEDFPDISSVLEIPYDDHVEVKKQALLDTLDRLSLFVDPVDNNGVRLTFKESGLQVEDFKRNSVEVLEYLKRHQPNGEASVVVNLEFLKDLLGSLTLDSATIYYGNEMPLKLVEGGVVQILGIISEESAEG